ncbi:MAG: hypothetical protein P9M07_00350 [Candidatus Aceula meridiana]|nr:hypothetical protein [Candidatus Aceula meridiana]
MKKIHTFHIPVMGTGFSLDTPLKVAKYGISSVISLVDDTLIEYVRKFYCERYKEEYVAITKKDEDCRARRITEYLNLIDRIVKRQTAELKSSAFEKGSEITKYFELLPDFSPFKKLYKTMLSTEDQLTKKKLQNELRESVEAGSIDVNIMTKLDATSYGPDNEKLPEEFSDALAALRGYAKSTLSSALVLSAGFNRKLYGYLENFKDFYCDKAGQIKKKIVLKVSDYRSCITQGKFLAKKGLWVSEYRIESGLNCGGHAFVSKGFLLGPILEEMKNKKNELLSGILKVYQETVKLKNKMLCDAPPEPEITVQGGIGTFEEDRFLQDYYHVDGTGWATPFLLVPEVANVDEPTLEKLRVAEEDDVYVSDVSPIGVPFLNLRGSFSDLAQEKRTQEGHPGSSCPKNHLTFNFDFTDRPVCLASRQYQKLKLEQIEKFPEQEPITTPEEVVVKTCICHDLGAGILLKNNIKTKEKELNSAICPGPNIAYFSKIMTLEEMIGHIYGRFNALNEKYRPHMFVKELTMYMDTMIKQMKKCKCTLTEKQIQYFSEFKKNLLDGVTYYQDLFTKAITGAKENRERILEELKGYKEKIENLEFSPRNPFHPTDNA